MVGIISQAIRQRAAAIAAPVPPPMSWYSGDRRDHIVVTTNLVHEAPWGNLSELVDGDSFANAWQPGIGQSAIGKWIQLFFGGHEVQIGRAGIGKLDWPASLARRYEASNDGINWTMVTGSSGANNPGEVVFSNSGPWKYIRWVGVTGSFDTSSVVSEFSISP